MKVTTDACLFGAIVPSVESGRILDIGAGTGLLSLMQAQKSKASIDAVEIEPNAQRQAEENFKNSPWKERLILHSSPIQEFSSPRTFDLIICNPPFFKDNYKGESTGRNQALHNDTLSFFDLVDAADRLLNAAGEFWVMYPEHEMEVFDSMVQNHLHLKQTITIRNNSTSPVFRRINAYARTKPKNVLQSNLDIRSANGNYTQSFINLLEPYYLHL